MVCVIHVRNNASSKIQCFTERFWKVNCGKSIQSVQSENTITEKDSTTPLSKDTKTTSNEGMYIFHNYATYG